jgi:hypothetical protein
MSSAGVSVQIFSAKSGAYILPNPVTCFLNIDAISSLLDTLLTNYIVKPKPPFGESQ